MIWGSMVGLWWHWHQWRSWVCCVGLQCWLQPRSCRGRCREWWPADSGSGCLAQPGLRFLCWPIVLRMPCARCLGLCVGVSSALLDTTARHAPTVAGCVRTRSKLRLRGCVQGYSWAAASQGSLRARLGSGGTCLPAALHGAASKSLVPCVRGALL